MRVVSQVAGANEGHSHRVMSRETTTGRARREAGRVAFVSGPGCDLTDSQDGAGTCPSLLLLCSFRRASMLPASCLPIRILAPCTRLAPVVKTPQPLVESPRCSPYESSVPGGHMEQTAQRFRFRVVSYVEPKGAMVGSQKADWQQLARAERRPTGSLSSFLKRQRQPSQPSHCPLPPPPRLPLQPSQGPESWQRPKARKQRGGKTPRRSPSPTKHVLRRSGSVTPCVL